jgi:hypothetical protein
LSCLVHMILRTPRIMAAEGVPMNPLVKPFLNQELSDQFDSPRIYENRNTIDTQN